MMREKAGSLEFLVRAPVDMKLESLGKALVREYIKSMQKKFSYPGAGSEGVLEYGAGDEGLLYPVSDLKPIYPQEISGQEKYERLIDGTDELLEKNDNLVRAIQRAYLNELEERGDLLPSTQAYLNRAAGVTFKKAKPKGNGKTFYSELQDHVADKLLYRLTKKVKNGLFRRKKKIVTEEVIDILTKENDLPIEDEKDEMFVNNMIQTFAPTIANDGGEYGDMVIFNDKERKKHKIFPYLATALFALGMVSLAGCTDNGDDDSNGNKIIEGKRTGVEAYHVRFEGIEDDVTEYEIREQGANHKTYLWFLGTDGFNSTILGDEIHDKGVSNLKVEVVKLDPTPYLETLGGIDGEDEEIYSYRVTKLHEPNIENTRGH